MAQVDGAIEVRSMRAADQAIYRQRSTDIDGEQNLIVGLPSGEPACMILEVQIDINSLATMMPSVYEVGVAGYVIEVAGLPVDLLGVTKWRVVSGTFAAGTRITAHLKPDQPAIWKLGERVQFLHPEVDTNGAPTADRETYIRVRRLPASYTG